MTQPASLVLPSASPREAALLDVKYQIFRESIDLQRKWRSMVSDACS